MARTKPRRLMAFDTEDDSQGRIQVLNFFDGFKHTTFEVPKPGMEDHTRARAWTWLEEEARKDPLLMWACNVEYDLVNLFGHRWLGKLCTLQYVKAGILRATMTTAPVMFYDTTRHWPNGSVAQMGSVIGLPKLNAVFDGSMSRRDLVRYCQRDTEIVWRFVDAMIHRYESLGLSIKATLPSMALQLFAKTFWKQEWIRFPETILEFFRRGYYGGRVEVFWKGAVNGWTNHYDVNSLFPSVMKAKPFPELSSWWVTSNPDWTREGMADVVMALRPAHIPGMPVRHEDEIVYPYGRIEGVWTYAEIRKAMEDGGKLFRVLSAVEFTDTCSPFAAYVDYCYRERQRATHVMDNLFWKLMMNSLYGKFGQNMDGNVQIVDDEERAMPSRGTPAHVNVVWSAYVTSWARLRLLDSLRSCSQVYYTDTDSIFTPDRLPVSDALGDLKLEGEYQHAEFIGNKLYTVDVRDATTEDVTTKYVAKGVRKDVARDFLRRGRAVYRKPARFRESRKSFVQANVWYDVEKERETIYTKREVRRDPGPTYPWRFDDYVKMKAAVPRGTTEDEP